MRFGRRWTGVALVLIPAVLLVGAAACGSDDNSKTTKSSTTAATAAAGGASGAAASAAVTVVGTDNKFAPENVTIKANQEASVTFDNKGEAIHNWHVLNQKSKDGKDITTQLIAAGKSETLKFTIDKAGTYDVHCDVHPADMKGKLIVQ